MNGVGEYIGIVGAHSIIDKEFIANGVNELKANTAMVVGGPVKHVSKGKMIVGENTYNVEKGSIILIPDGAFHKVWNTADESLGEHGDLVFICVFDGTRKH